MGVDIIEARQFAHLLAYTLPPVDEFEGPDGLSVVMDTEGQIVEPEPQQDQWAVAEAIGEAATSQGMVLALTAAGTQIPDLNMVVR